MSARSNVTFFDILGVTKNEKKHYGVRNITLRTLGVNHRDISLQYGAGLWQCNVM